MNIRVRIYRIAWTTSRKLSSSVRSCVSPRSSNFSGKKSSSFLGLRTVLLGVAADELVRGAAGRDGLVILLDLPSIERSVFGIFSDGLASYLGHRLMWEVGGG